MMSRCQPSDLASPVVSNQVERLRAKDVGQIQHVGDKTVRDVTLYVGRPNAP